MNLSKEKLIEIIRHKKDIGRVDATDLGAEELAEQIIEADRLNNGKATSEAKEKYQILEFKQKSGIEDVWKQKNHNEWCRYHNEAFVTIPYTFNEILNHEQYYIHTVQYTSPSGETKVFTVGKCEGMNKITAFKIVEYKNSITNILALISQIWVPVKMLSIAPAKQPLFQDLLGNDLFKGDRMYFIELNANRLSCTDAQPKVVYGNNDGLIFKFREDAEEYLKEHAITFSLNDFKKYFGDCPPFNMDELEQLAKDRLNLS